MGLWTILADVVLLLAASLVLGGIFSKWGQTPILGYLIAGMLLGGPGSFQLVHSETEIEAIAELGVALLLFSLGLEFSTQKLKLLGVKSLCGGALQVVCTIMLTAAAAAAFGLDPRTSLAFGMMVSLSSTAVVLRTLMERAEIDMPHGRNSLAVLLTQDIAVVPLAVVMSVMAGAESGQQVSSQVLRLLFSTSVLICALYLLTRVAVRFLGSLTLLRNRELTVLFAVVTGLGATGAAHAAGISPALGAFIGGMLLGSSEFSTQIRADISSLRVVLLTLFFGAAGMVADPVWIFENWQLVLGVTFLLTVAKFLVVWIIFRLLHHSVRVSATTGLCLAQLGEFAFVLGSIGKSNGVITSELYALVVSVTILSFFISAFLIPFAPKFGAFVASLYSAKESERNSDDTSNTTPEIVIIGFGPAGRIAAQPFIDSRESTLVIDLNREGVRQAGELGFQTLVGDATQGEVLEHAHISQARIVVISIPDHRSALSILTQVRVVAPHAHTVVRSRYQRHTEELIRAGAHIVIGDEEGVGERLANHLRTWLEVSEEASPREHS